MVKCFLLDTLLEDVIVNQNKGINCNLFITRALCFDFSLYDKVHAYVF